MAVNLLNSIEDSSPENIRSQKCCRNKYKVRCFYSKGTLLVLICFCLISVNIWYPVELYDTLFQGLKGAGPYSNVALVPVLPFFILVPLYGWLADVYFGNFKVFKAGLVLSFFSVILCCICVLILTNVNDSSTLSLVVSGGVSPVVCILSFSGLSACAVTALQLGLDQMPDASSPNVASFITWFVFSVFLRFWIFDTVKIPSVCTGSVNNPWSISLYSFLYVICSTISCCIVFLLAPKWLIIEPNCPQSLINIYQVFKFATKHKAPLNRSAFTYWEEGIPSRLDLGKSRYGGPFTTEQVENVKTFFKIIAIILPLLVVVVSVSLKYSMALSLKETIPGLSACSSMLVYTFTYSPWWCSIVTILINELVLYPLFKYKLPGILKYIGIVSFLALISNIAFLGVSIFDLLYALNLSFWLRNLYSIVVGIFQPLIIMKLLEFVCAQSPYNMRGLLAGYGAFAFFFAHGIGAAMVRLSDALCQGYYCLVIQNSAVAALSLIGFTLYCILARWYKWRVRDEEYDVHRVVEEVYDRYLSNR